MRAQLTPEPSLTSSSAPRTAQRSHLVWSTACLSAAALAVAAPVLTGSSAFAAGSGTSTAGPTVSVVASGLANPRGLAFGEHGSLVVALAGGGAHDSSVILIPHAGWSAPGAPVTLASGLASVNDPHGAPPGVGTSGAVSVSVDNDHLYVQMSLFAEAGDPQLGSLLSLGRGGALTTVANVGSFDFAWAAAHSGLSNQFPDANPNAVLAVGGKKYVADAGANTLDEVAASGRVKVLRFFGVPHGSVADSSVPTCLARGRDGSLFVGELLGGAYARGGARVWKVTTDGGQYHASVYATGLTTIQGCAVGADGALYVTEFQTGGLDLSPTGNPSGDIVRIGRHGEVTPLNVPGLLWPSGLAAGADGSLYTSNCSIAPATGFGPCVGGGQVVRVR